MTHANVTIQNAYTKRAYKLNHKRDFLTLLNRWVINFKSRRDLARLSDDQLKDVGISREDAHKEATKVFWER